MNLFEINFASSELGHQTNLTVLLPSPNDLNGSIGKTKILFLLHGFSDDHTGWMRKTMLEFYARDYNLAVVMPNAHNSFYTNMRHGLRYLDHIVIEVPEFVQKTFNFSSARKDNFIAGLSMGGYGAFKAALTHPQKFLAAASLSGVLDIQYAVDTRLEDDISRFILPMQLSFGSTVDIKDTPDDIPWLLNKVSRENIKPRLFQSCGTEDNLYINNQRIRNLTQSLDFDYTYEEGPGDHNWKYWDFSIQRVLEWLPLEKIQRN